MIEEYSLESFECYDTDADSELVKHTIYEDQMDEMDDRFERDREEEQRKKPTWCTTDLKVVKKIPVDSDSLCAAAADQIHGDSSDANVIAIKNRTAY